MKYWTVLFLLAFTACADADKIEVQIGPTPKGSSFIWIIETDSEGAIKSATRYNAATKEILDELVVTKKDNEYHAEYVAGNLKVSHDIFLSDDKAEDRMTSVNAYLKKTSTGIRTFEYRNGLILSALNAKGLETIDMADRRIVGGENKSLLERDKDVIHVYSDGYVLDVIDLGSSYRLTYKGVPQMAPVTRMTVEGKLILDNKRILLINLCLLPHDLLFLLFL